LENETRNKSSDNCVLHVATVLLWKFMKLKAVLSELTRLKGDLHVTDFEFGNICILCIAFVCDCTRSKEGR